MIQIDIPSVQTKIKVVEEYIFKVKGVRVNIVMYNYDYHIELLNVAYLIAIKE
jgi:hypothetical protein